MQIKYSEHLSTRLNLRNIPLHLPEKIVRESEERYSDKETGHTIAVMKVSLYAKVRDVMVAYTKEDDDINLITIHPLKFGQKENRILKGRWRKYYGRI
jgi:hypothetical protein